MIQHVKNNLVVNVCWSGELLTVREIIDLSKQFLLDLEKTTPWVGIVDASGGTRSCLNMRIADDFSNFEEIVLKAIEDKGVKYVKKPDDKTYGITLDSIGTVASIFSFSDYPTRSSADQSINITVTTNARVRKKNMVLHGFSFRIPFYLPGEVNHHWADGETVRALLHFLIDRFDPIYAWAARFDDAYSVLERGIDSYRLNWISYTKNARFKKALYGFPYTKKYGNGVMIDLGEDVSTLEDPATEKKVVIIRDQLRKADATDWLLDSKC